MIQDAEYTPVMPFVVCTSQGGPYDDAPFVAGVRFGDLHRLMRSLPPEITTFRHVDYWALMPQIDLLAMHERWQVDVDASEGEAWSDEWACMTFTRIHDREGAA